MSNDQDSQPSQSWYSQVASTHTPEQLKNWYGEVAEAYNHVRPRYPQKLIARAVEVAQLPVDASILELGSGPGIATTAFAELGFSIVCLEPSLEACQVLQKNCSTYPQVEIRNTTFEDWELLPQKFNAVLAATSFHWISPEIAYSKAADALQDNGSLILLWNMSAQPNAEVYQALNAVYQTQAPSLNRYEERAVQEAYLRQFGQAIINSGQFKNLVSEQLACEVTYSIDDYLTLLSTYSAYIQLKPQERNSLFIALREVLEKTCGSSLQIFYLSAFHIAQKI